MVGMAASLGRTSDAITISATPPNAVRFWREFRGCFLDVSASPSSRFWAILRCRSLASLASNLASTDRPGFFMVAASGSGASETLTQFRMLNSVLR